MKIYSRLACFQCAREKSSCFLQIGSPAWRKPRYPQACACFCITCERPPQRAFPWKLAKFS